MKKLLVILLVTITALSLFASGAQEEAVENVAEEGKPVVTEWAKENKINDGSETEAELYEKAKKEGKVVVYSSSSRMAKACESFMAEYPGIEAEVVSLKVDVIKEKVMAEHEAGVSGADLIHVTDDDGSLYLEYVMPGIMSSYYPDDIMAHFTTPKSELKGFPFQIAAVMWFYNTELNPDGVDIDSWWDLTREEWRGKIIMNDLLTKQSYIAQFAALGLVKDQLIEEYKREFGEDIVYTCGVNDPVYELVYRLLNNDIVYTPGSDEAVTACGAAGVTENKIAWGPSSKLRNNENKGFHLGIINMKPAIGIPNYHYLYVIDNCDHPNAAKLLTRYLAGGSDGQSAGYVPFNTLGAWSLRDDIPLLDGANPITDYTFVPSDPSYIYEATPDMADFVLKIVGK